MLGSNLLAVEALLPQSRANLSVPAKLLMHEARDVQATVSPRLTVKGESFSDGFQASLCTSTAPTANAFRRGQLRRQG